MTTDAIIYAINTEHPSATAGELARLYVERTGIDAWQAGLIAGLYLRATQAEAALTVSQSITTHLQTRLVERDELIKDQREMLNALRVKLYSFQRSGKLPATAPFPRI